MPVAKGCNLTETRLFIVSPRCSLSWLVIGSTVVGSPPPACSVALCILSLLQLKHTVRLHSFVRCTVHCIRWPTLSEYGLLSQFRRSACVGALPLSARVCTANAYQIIKNRLARGESPTETRPQSHMRTIQVIRKVTPLDVKISDGALWMNACKP